MKECLEHPWIKPRRSVDEDVRRTAQINLEHLKSFIARRRWKVQMQCESRSVRTVTTKYTDSEGNVKSRRRAELSGKSVLYEGEYSETDSEGEGGDRESGGSLIRNLGGMSIGSAVAAASANPGQAGTLKIGLDSIKIMGGGSGQQHHKLNQLPADVAMMKRQKVMTQIPPNIELKPVKVTEFNENIDEHSDDEENDPNRDDKR